MPVRVDWFASKRWGVLVGKALGKVDPDLVQPCLRVIFEYQAPIFVPGGALLAERSGLVVYGCVIE